MRRNFFIIRCRLKSGIPARNSQTFELSPKFGKQKTATRAINKKRLEDSAPSRRVRSENFAPSANAPPPNARQTREKTITRAVPPLRYPHCTHGAPRENLPAPPQKIFPPRRKRPALLPQTEAGFAGKCGFPAAFRAKGILNADAFGFSSACYPDEFLSNCSFFSKAGHFLVDPSALF